MQLLKVRWCLTPVLSFHRKFDPIWIPSKELRNGFEQQGASASVFFLNHNTDNGQQLVKAIRSQSITAMISVGPEASRLIFDHRQLVSLLKVYAMVLNPEKVINASDSACGVPLNLSIPEQESLFTRYLPNLKNIGLLFNPTDNGDFFDQAARSGGQYGIGIIPLSVASRKQIPTLLNQHWDRIDALWFIPDKTVISESLVRYIIKEAISQRVPVIGYNRFFYDNGAALVTAFDYTQIGRQAGSLLFQLADGEPCQPVTPAHTVMVNETILTKMGVFFRSTPLESRPAD